MNAIFTVFAIIAVLAASIVINMDVVRTDPRVLRVRDYPGAVLARETTRFNAYTYSHAGNFPADGPTLDSSGGYGLPPAPQGLTVSYGYNTGTTTAILCVSGNLKDRAALNGFIAGVSAVGGSVTAGLDCSAGTPKVLSPSAYPASASATFILTNKSRSSTLAITPANMSFTTTVNTTSPGKTITVWNNGSTAVTLSAVSVSAGFIQTNNCPTSLAVNAKCTFTVAFKPTATGMYSGNLTIQDSAYGSTHTIALMGTA